MGNIDYQKLGFKCGLEIHQQLEGKKLFCDCPTLNSNEEADVRFTRRLRAVAGETGQVDVAAKHEMQKGKKFIYESSSKDTCLVELDEEPPHEINKEALKTALLVALILNAKIIDRIQFMRKTVIDGSNTSGFQRTAMIAHEGYIDSSKGRIKIQTICLEEEAAQKIKDENGSVTYRLDRLGIPLIEIATDASIKDMDHAKEVAAYIGMILRSVKGTKRGLGTIRQDVNISINKGARTEVKGFQDLKSIPKVIDFEVNRQLKLIKANKKLVNEVRKAEQDLTTSFLRPMPGAARLYPETDVLPIKVEEKHIKDLKKKLPKLLSEKSSELEKKYKINKDLANELLNVDYFEEFVKKFVDLEASLIVHTLVNTPKEIKKRYELDPSILRKEDFEEILTYFNQGKVSKEAVIDLLIKKIKKEKISLEEFEAVSDKMLEQAIKELISKKKGLSIGAYMGILMGKYRGKVDGKKIMEILKRYVK
jgi:Glu-tRNA(Gln) amidotransferase subunit E-like FAD-binding protein